MSPQSRPSDGPTLELLAPGAVVVGVRFRPGAAPPALGVPALELLDLGVGAHEVWGRPAAARGAAGGERLAGRCRGDARGGGPREDGRRCRDPVGLAPKAVQQMLRFQGFLALAQHAGADLARLAADAGCRDRCSAPTEPSPTSTGLPDDRPPARQRPSAPRRRGAAATVVPVSALSRRAGRRAGLTTALGVGALGGWGWSRPTRLTASPAARRQPRLRRRQHRRDAGPLRRGGSDLSTPSQRGRAIGLVVFATTFGAVAGPNLPEPAGQLAGALGLPELTGLYLCSAAALLLAAIVLFRAPAPGLVLLGVGWNAGLIAGSPLLASAVPVSERPRVEGVGELSVGVATATAAAVAAAALGPFLLAVARRGLPAEAAPAARILT